LSSNSVGERTSVSTPIWCSSLRAQPKTARAR
jgi:hypothetical protein